MTPEQLRALAEELLTEVRPLLPAPATSWRCLETALLCLGADRATGGHGRLAVGELRLDNGDVCQHYAYLHGDPGGTMVHGHEGAVRVVDRRELPLKLGTVGA